MAKCILFLSDGQLAVYHNNSAQLLTSQRQQKYEETLRALEEKYEWKTSGAGAQFMEQHNPYANRSQLDLCRITALTHCQGQLLYALSAQESGGLYSKDPFDATATEGLRFSDRSFTAHDLDAHGDLIVCAVDTIRGERHLALFEEGEAGYRILTQGDTEDSAPFLSRREEAVYYASCGYARDDSGALLAKGPSSLLKLNLSTGDLKELFEDAAFDYLRPKEGPDGALYYIRRPYAPPKPERRNLLNKIQDVGSVLKGMGRFFKAMSGKAPTPAAAASSDVKAMTQKRMLDGAWLDISQSEIASDASIESGCVPADWILFRCAPGNEPEMIQKGVADYDFDGDSLVYSDGRRIFSVCNGQRTLLHRAVFIPRISVIPEDAFQANA